MKKNIPVFVTHYGCPNQCVFCNQKKISGVTQAMTIESCEKLLEEASKLGYSPQDTEIAFFGGSFTGIPVEDQIRYLEIARRYRSYFGGIRLSTRPDYITSSTLELLKEYGVTTIELGVQSMVDHVLTKNQRGMSADDTKNAVRLIKKYDFSLGLQMMTSMYGSTQTDDIYTAEEMIRLQPDFVRIYPTVVLEDTQLYQLYRQGNYQVLPLEDSVSHVAQIYELFVKSKIPVIRVGLMASEEISPGKVIGSYHEAFGELVQGEVFFQQLTDYLKEKETKGKRLRISCHPRRVSTVVGHQKRNVNRLREIFLLKAVKVCGTLTEGNDEFFFRAEFME
ncbi:MAG: radical SAM protein [Clostridia bacterium]|nr:radical SAM protein [Clostridia bacterium]